MEMWRAETHKEQRPKVLDSRVVVIAVISHVAFFVGLWVLAIVNGCNPDKKDECNPEKKDEIVPIDIMIGEPPPPPKPKPKTKPKTKPEPKPKNLDKIVTNKVEKVEKKPEKKEQPKPPKKTKEQLRAEKIKRIQESAKDTNRKVEMPNPSQPQPNDRIDKPPANWEDIINPGHDGHVPSSLTSLATSDLERGVSLVKMALDEKWKAISPSVGASGIVVISCRFNALGGIIDARITASCGDALSDKAALSVARAVTVIYGLPETFKAKFSKEPIKLKYTVIGH